MLYGRGTLAESVRRIGLMLDNNPKLLLHRANGETLEVRADEILSVEAQSDIYGARIMLTRTDADGRSLQLIVRESADAVARQLAGTESALMWQGE